MPQPDERAADSGCASDSRRGSTLRGRSWTRSVICGGIVLGLTGLLAPAAPAMAEPVPWLYDVDVAVQGRDAAARTAVSGEALLVVLSRVSGLAHVPRNARVREALGSPEAYYDRFVFLDDDSLRIHFTPSAVLRLVDEARLPVWSANRPQAMAWLVVERGGDRRIVDGEHPLAATLARRARQRGLVVKLPLMDLEDRMRIQPAVVRGRLFSPLEEASRRYGADLIVAGQVWEQPCVQESPESAEPEEKTALESAGAFDEHHPQGADRAEEPSRKVATPGNQSRDRCDEQLVPTSGEFPHGVPEDRVECPLGVRESTVVDESLQESTEPYLAPGEDSVVDLELASLWAPLAESSGACGTAGGFFHSGSLQAWMGGEEFATGFAVADLEQAAYRAVDFIADELTARYAVLAREPHAISLVVRGIDTPVGYGRLLGYLDDLEFIGSVDVAAVEAGRLEVTLHTRAGLEQLLELFENDGRMRPDPANASVLIWQGP